MNLKKKTLVGLAWTFTQQFSQQLINFGISIILARLLLPEDFGLIGMIAVFISIGNSLMSSGMTSSLIRDNEVGQIDYSTVFFTNLGFSIAIYLLLFFSAPAIAIFFDRDVLVGLLRVYCLTFIIRAFAAVQYARLTKIMDFKTQMIVNLPSLIISGLLGIGLALFNYGVWSLVFMYVLQSLLSTLQVWYWAKWSPSFIFDKKVLKKHFGFGIKLTLSSLLDTFYSNIYNLIIGKYFSAAQLGYYTRAQSMKQLPVKNLSSAINKVTYPMFSSIGNDDKRLKFAYKRLMQQVVFWVAPVLVIAGILAEPLFRFLLTEKWLPAVPYFQILCIVGIMYPLNSYNLNILKVKGRSDLFLRLEVIKKVIITIGIVIAIPFGIYGLLWFQAINSFIAFGINSYYSGRFIDYPLSEQIKDIVPILGIAILMGITAFFGDRWLLILDPIDLVRLVIISAAGLLFYLMLSYAFRLSALQDFKNLALNR